MAPKGRSKKINVIEDELEAMKVKNSESSEEELWGTRSVGEGNKESSVKSSETSPDQLDMKSATQSPKKQEQDSPMPITAKDEHEEVLGGEITVKLVSGKPPKLSRSSSHKVVARTAVLFDEYPDKTQEATSNFQVITECNYSTKSLGSTEHAMECDCTEEWDATAKRNHACGEDSDCINRATKMECVGDCGCGAECQNQRFQQRQYATVSVIKTEKKGYGLRADTDLQANDFIFEYIGEVIHEGQFRKRTIQYDDEGVKHFYFMSLSKGEFVDATKKGNLGRFCNHSCNPNCFVDKWVVGEKLRMGIFAERNIKAGEELVFNYNVDRYGADPQPCYCGEPNCTGFLGGKTQTERATKLSHATIEALGIDDGDGWDLAVAKKPRKKKVGEDDEEYVNNVQSRSLDEDAVTKVMATLLQCKEKWIAVKLLDRIQRCDEEKVMNRVVKMHGYQILSSALSTWKEDFNVVLQILDILNRFPRLTKNKISDSKIESTVASLAGCGDEQVETQSAALLREWSTLETAYRIPRKQRDPNATSDSHNHFERRESGRDNREHRSRSRSRSPTRSRSRSKSFDAPRGPAALSGPRNNQPQRNTSFYSGNRTAFRPLRPFNTLPTGWFAASANGSTYYYSAAGQTTWVRPTMPAAQPPPPPKPVSTTKALDDIINQITSAKAIASERVSAAVTPKPDIATPEKKSGKEKWRSLPEEKQKKIYENTLFPHIKYVMDKYNHKLPKEDLKRFAKEISKKLVNSDYKNNRVDDPSKITPKQEKNVKKFVKDFFDKVVAKKKEHDKKLAAKKAKHEATKVPSAAFDSSVTSKNEAESDVEESINVSEDSGLKDQPNLSTPNSPSDRPINGEGLKRKRESDGADDDVRPADEETISSKRSRSMTPSAPPPPPPPPPAEDMPEQHRTVDDTGSCENESFRDSSHSTNGHVHVNQMDAEAVEACKSPPPPPPPPPEMEVDSTYQKEESFLHTPIDVAMFDLPSAGVVDYDTSEGPIHDLNGLHPERMGYLEAQNSM